MAALVVSPGATTASYTLVPGTPTTVTISDAGGTATATFTGAVGQRISLNFSSVTITSSSVSIRKPDGTNLVTRFTVTKSGYFFDVQTLPVAGTYKVVIDAKSDYAGRMTLKLYDVPADPSVAIAADGALHTVTTTVPGQKALLTFAGTAGQRVSVNLTDVSMKAAKLRVLTPPDGAPLYATPLSFSIGGGFLEPKAPLPATGQYTLVVDPTLTYTGSATVQLYNVPADNTGSITPNGSVTALATTVPGQNASRTFTLAAAQRVSLKLSGSTYGLVKVSLVKLPERTPMFSPSRAISPLGTYISPVTLAAGNYEVFVDPQSAETGTVDLQAFIVPPDVSGSITPGTPQTITTAAPGQDASYSFTGTAGQRYSLNLTNSSFDSAKAWIFKSSDPTIKSPSVTVTPTGGGFLEPWTLPSNGTYKVKIDPVDAAYGSMDVGLYLVRPDVSNTIVANGSPLTISTLDPGQNAVVRFTVGAAKRVSLDLSGVTMATQPSSGVSVRIKRPDTTTLAQTTLGTNGSFVDTRDASQIGTYKIEIDPQKALTGSITLKLYSPVDLTAPIPLTGTPTPVTIGTPGQNANLTFTGTVGHRIAFRVSQGAVSPLKVSVIRPGGAYEKFPTNVNVDPQFLDTEVAFAVGGTYKINLDPQLGATGTVTVTACDVTDVGGSLGATNTVNITTPGQNALLAFTGTALQVITVTPQTGWSAAQVNASVVKADKKTRVGTQRYWTPVSGDPVQVTLPASGTYYFLVDPIGDATGSVSFDKSGPA